MNFTNNNFNDETLLAYVLNELDSAEANQIESAAKTDAALKEKIETLRAETELVRDAFTAENAADALDKNLEREREEFISTILSLEEAQEKSARKNAIFTFVKFAGGFSVAACLLFVLGISFKTEVPEYSQAVASKDENVIAVHTAPIVLGKITELAKTIDTTHRPLLDTLVAKGTITAEEAESIASKSVSISEAELSNFKASGGAFELRYAFGGKASETADVGSAMVGDVPPGSVFQGPTLVDSDISFQRPTIVSKFISVEAGAVDKSAYPVVWGDTQSSVGGTTTVNAGVAITSETSYYSASRSTFSATMSLPVESQHVFRGKAISQEPISSNESYSKIEEPSFAYVSEKPLSTFSIDVDSASYANVRRMIDNHQMPPPDAVRAEEFINYFSYSYKSPSAESKVPFSATLGIARAPWNENSMLVRVGLKVRDIEWQNRPASNLVFLVDVSGSMSGKKRIELVKKSLTMLVNKLDRRDRVAIVTYANNVRLALPSTSADNSETILHAIRGLYAAGGTNGEGGIELAYETAQKSMIKNGVNRIILCTDGDFNIGKSSNTELMELIKEKAKCEIFLSVAGFGMGNYKDSTMETLAHNGNGNYSYIDSEIEARKVFVSEASAKLNCQAKDVKIQVEWNPQNVKSYKLIGYENRRLAAEDFNNDKKDAGDAGAGDTVTAIYEIVPADAPATETPAIDELKYSKIESRKAYSAELATVKIRWKEPTAQTSEKVEFAVVAPAEIPNITSCDEDFRFALSAAMFAMKLRGNPALKNVGYQDVLALAKSAVGNDDNGTRGEFLELVRKSMEFCGER